MKKLMLFSGLIVLVVFTFFYFYKSPSQIYVAEDTASLVEEKMILLYPESGEVSFKAKSNDPFIVATASPTEIPNNAIVHTGVGKASVLLPDNSTVTLAENTEITITYTPTKTSMYQSFGTTYHRVEKLITGASYQVQTAGTLAAVRGTKFVVSYDVKQKKTKVAVTESKVEVTTITKATSATAEPRREETVMVETGKTVTVDAEHRTKNKEGKLTAITERTIEEDIEIRAVVEREKKGDSDLETIKKEEKEKKLNKTEVRKEIKRVMFKDVKDRDDKKDDTENDHADISENKVEIKKAEGEAPVTTTTKPADTSSALTQPGVVSTPVAVMDEEKFFTQFEPLFIKYFYIDDVDTACLVRVSPNERVKIVTDFAVSRGYPFTKVTLPSFAQAINEYCVNKDASVKIKLQARFDDEYPF